MNFTVLSIFPELFDLFWRNGIIKRAIDRKVITFSTLNIRDFAKGRYKATDDRPYGGGSGMLMKPEPLADAVLSAKKQFPSSKTILLTPQGRVFNHVIAKELSEAGGLIFVCCRYEGVDERIRTDFVDDEISIGDFVLTGGELVAMVIIDAVTRLLPESLGGSDSAECDSFSNGLLEHAHYTRPQNFEGRNVPDVLLSGNHEKIENW
eukprot:CAMPEP_0201285700 /NCGR_PEP_ID=MMETSP1317-20130820/113707_1 /ASSEMBLY_ACC=CAM_ASM_000770 /TAXON_ID=187299 /ORGANISM="Undescribed Undescribed, Strain Undescribed" /LENGTH=206 /DNA_ID=CAMNT_0047611503 /DNA_START=2506 /DNA_END=3123 /DNA_ORIENTATION=+